MTVTEKKGFLIVIMITLSSCGFFNPFGLISPQLSKFLFYLFTICGWYWAWRNCPNNISNYPKTEFKLIISGIIASVLMSCIFHDQSLLVSFLTTMPTICAYSFFPMLIKLQIPKLLIFKMITILVFISMVTFIANVISFPKKIFGETMEEYDMSRGLPRLGVPFLLFFVFLFFKYINEIALYKLQKKIILRILLIGLFIVLSLTRQIIGASFALGLLLIIHKASLLKKIFIATIVFVFVLYVLPQIPIFNTMKELSEYQAAQNELVDEDIRIKAWRYYTYENQTNYLSPIFGNGIPSIGHSKWGDKFEKEIYPEYGGNACYGVDVGWAGFFWNYGLISTVGLFLLLSKAMIKKKTAKDTYFSYWFLFIIGTSVSSAPILFPFQIVSICTILYLLYGSSTYDNDYN